MASCCILTLMSMSGTKALRRSVCIAAELRRLFFSLIVDTTASADPFIDSLPDDFPASLLRPEAPAASPSSLRLEPSPDSSTSLLLEPPAGSPRSPCRPCPSSLSEEDDGDGGTDGSIPLEPCNDFAPVNSAAVAAAAVVVVGAGSVWLPFWSARVSHRS